MLHLEKAVLSSCILCGMLAVYYMSVYVIVSVIVALPLVLYLESKVNRSKIHVRGITSPTAFQKLLIYFRLWSHSALIWVMKTCKQLRPVAQRSGTSEISPYTEESNLTFMETPQGNNTTRHDSGLYGENFEYSRRNSFSPYSSCDSVLSTTRFSSRSQRSLHRTPNRSCGDTGFLSKDSPWGKSVSPKLRSHGAGVKTVQTVAGPLLASTRFNISGNIRTYGDVSSPGLSSRVARYAEDSKMLTHQKQYSGPGQFPLVQLDHSASRLPILSYHKLRRSAHIPVTVRIAPPHSSDARFLSKSQILGASSVEDQHPSKSVLDVLKEMSRKRIYAQIDDSEDDDVTKRQRMGEGQNIIDRGSNSQPVQDDIIVVGKRARVESHSQTDTNCQPLQHQEKRTRNNEIFSSLSSSRNLLNHRQTSTKRKSSTADGSRSGTPVMGKPPKQSRDSIGDAANIIPKTTTVTVPTTSSTHTRTTSATAPTLSIHHTEEKSPDKPEIVQPSEFLPKFAAVLDKSTPPVLNSVAALEAKRAYDRQTRLRSMLAVIAGEDDFTRKPSSSNNDVIASTTPTTSTSQSVCPVVSSAAEVREMISAAETSVPSGTQVQCPTDSIIQTAAAKSSELSSNTSLTMSNNFSAAVPNTSAANTNFELSGSATSVTNQTTSSLTSKLSSPTCVAVSSEQKVPLLIPNPLSNNVAPTEEKIDPIKDAVVTSSAVPCIFGKPQSSHSALNSSLNASDPLSKISSDSAPQLATSCTSDNACSGSNTPSSTKEQTSHGAVTDGSCTSGDFSSSTASTVIEVVKPVVPETTMSLFSFGNTAVSHTVNTSNSTSTATTSNSVFGSIFTSSNTRASVGSFASPSATTSNSIPAPACVFVTAKSNDKPFAALPSASLNCGMVSATGNNSPFQLSAVTSSTTTTSTGGFKFDFSKDVKENAASSTVGGFKPVGNLAASSTEANAATSAVTSISTTTAVSTSTSATTSKSASQNFRTPPVFTFSNTNTVNGPSSGGFPGGTFGNSHSQTDRVTQKAQQSLFTFGSSSASSNGKSGGFAFSGSGSSPNQHSSEMFGSVGSIGSESGQAPQASSGNLPDQSSQPVFGGGGSKTDQSQPGSAIFGTLQSSGGVFGTAQPSQPAGGLFGNSGTQSGGIFGSSSSSSGQVQLTGGIFGTGTDPSSQSLLPSTGAFGSFASQMANPSGGLFGSGGNVSTPSAQPSVGLFGSSGNVSTPSTQPSGSIFGSSGSVSTPTTQPSGGLFGSSGNMSTPSTQPSGGLFGSSGNMSTPSTQPSVGLFGSGGNMSTPSTQPSVGLFGSSGNVSTPSMQPSAGLFGSGGNVSAPSTQPSVGLFGSSGNVSTPSTQPSGGIFGSTGNVSTPSTQPSGGIFGVGGILTTQASGGIFGSSGSLSVQASQPAPSPFGGVESMSQQTSQPSGGIFGTSSQPSGGLFSSGTNLTTQPAAGVFGGSGSTQPVFQFGTTLSPTPTQQPTAGGNTGLFGASAPFQFGAGNSNASVSATQPTGGFSFGSPSATAISFTAGTSGSPAFQFGAGTAPAFGSQATGQGMFSIGSGSTAPRHRASRLRRQK